VAVTYLTDESGNRLTTEADVYLILSRSGSRMAVTVTEAGARRVLNTDGRVVTRLAARVGETTTATVVLKTDGDTVDLSGATSVTWLARSATGATITGTADGNATTCDLVLAIPTGTTAGKYACWVQADGETWPTTTSAEQITLDVLPDR
jgi:hypothetical protein